MGRYVTTPGPLPRRESFDGIERLRSAAAACLQLRTKDAVPQQVVPGIYIGSVASARNRPALSAIGVSHVICCSREAECYFPLELQYLHLKIRDEAGVRIDQYFASTFAFIEGARRLGGAVLVHCTMGRSRSATIVAAYLIQKHGIRMLDALDVVRAARRVIAPNPSFALQLLRFERQFARQGRSQENGHPSSTFARVKEATVVVPGALFILLLSIAFALPLADATAVRPGQVATLVVAVLLGMGSLAVYGAAGWLYQNHQRRVTSSTRAADRQTPAGSADPAQGLANPSTGPP